MALVFKNASLNQDFEILAEKDQTIHTPDGYSGPITNIPNADILHGMVKRKSNLVQKKETAKAVTPPATKKD